MQSHYYHQTNFSDYYDKEHLRYDKSFILSIVEIE